MKEINDKHLIENGTQGTESVAEVKELKRKLKILETKFNKLALIVSDHLKNNDRGYADFIQGEKKQIGFTLNNKYNGS